MALATTISNEEMVGIFMPILVYWIYSGIYVVLESWFENYKLHSKREEEEKNLVSRMNVVKGVLLQQLFQAFVTYLFFKLTGGGNEEDGDRDLVGQPASFLVIATQFVVAMLVVDTYQYFTHRFMHHNKFLYKNFHSYHHRLVVPYSFGALYSHQVDGFLFDTIGGVLAALLSGMSPRVSTIFFCFASIKTIDDHGGLLLPGNPFHILFWNNTAYHDVHHQLYGGKYNFSQPFFVMWDKFMGTYMPYSLEKRVEGGFQARPLKESKDD